MLMIFHINLYYLFIQKNETHLLNMFSLALFIVIVNDFA